MPLPHTASRTQCCAGARCPRRHIAADHSGRAAASCPASLISAAPRAAGRGGPDGVAPTAVPGIVEVRRGADIVYMTRDGKYVFTGDLYASSRRHENLTEARRGSCAAR